MTTEPIQVIGLSDKVLDILMSQEREKEIYKQVSEFNYKIAELVMSFDHISNQNQRWIQVSNKDVYYHVPTDVLIPDLATFEIGKQALKAYDPSTFANKFAGYQGDLPTEQIIAEVFADVPFLEEKYGFEVPESRFTIRGQTAYGQPYVNREGNVQGHWGNIGSTSFIHHFPVKEMKKTTYAAERVLMLVQENLIPQEFDAMSRQMFELLVSFYRKNPQILMIEEEELVINEVALKNQSEITTLNGINSFASGSVKESYNIGNAISVPNIEYQLRNKAIQTLLECDHKRANIQVYDLKMLEDPNRGHWDVASLENGVYQLQLSSPLYYRPPHLDVKRHGTVSIDFGTKSTIVMYQNESERIMPMRIGTGDYLEALAEKQYENPTVLNFINLEDFLNEYKKHPGRPLTKWEDLTSSHTAYNSMLAQESSDTYYSFLYELKQWAGNKNHNLRIKDQNMDMRLNHYLGLTSEDFDPIEIYAYYIGLNINHMHSSGGIYMDYVLSYPATYEKAIRDKMIESFSRGIKKSFPTSILEDENLMRKFQVRIGASEPVAYAVCAMEQFAFEPEDGEEMFYSVFDFGGGTADFDFGIFREANDSFEEDGYDYVVKSFGDSGDRFLGGENLLELLAFEVFKDNLEVLQSIDGDPKRHVAFTLPPECNRFLGSEVLINESQEAKVNMSKLMTELRPYWEDSENYLNLDAESESVAYDEYGEAIVGGSDCTYVDLTVIDTQGTLCNCKIKIDKKLVKQVLWDRIEKGVKNFFESMTIAFQLPDNINKVRSVNIFLAGNSSKSPILKEIIELYIEKHETLFRSHNFESTTSFFQIFSPLGTEEAKEMQRARGVTGLSDISPTGKTGVAYGILTARPGGTYKLEQSSDDEIRFKYFIGNARKRLFRPTSTRDIGYDDWYYLNPVKEVDFTIYYTDLPLAHSGKLPIDQVKFVKCHLDGRYDGAGIFYRATSPSELEYVVAKVDVDDEGQRLKGEIVSSPIRVTLGD